MNTHGKINELWEQMRDSIDAAYKAEQADPERTANALSVPLRDYARDISWSDAVAALLGRETANERQHRNNRSVRGFSIQDAAKLIVMNCIARGSDRVGMPSAVEFLVFRQTAVESETVGFLAKAQISQSWKDRVAELDYSKLMAA